MKIDQWCLASGKRKSTIAKVKIGNGTGKIIINDNRRLWEYWLLKEVYQPIIVTGIFGIDVFISVKGGGESGMIGAIRLGLAKALCDYDNRVGKILREYGLLTIDVRKVEEKKLGLLKARKKKQFSKR